MVGAIRAGAGTLALAGEVIIQAGVWAASMIRSGVTLIMHTDLIIGVVTIARGLVVAIMHLDTEPEMLII